MDIYSLENSIQHYDWGSRSHIQNLLGLDDEAPAAELWMGAHPKAPSEVILPEGRRGLAELLHENPEKVLGKKTADKFGGGLPFLFKALAAARALSIQAHPDKKSAEEGFRRENDQGIPVDAFERNYRDDNHKPEVLCALTEFTGLCGFRGPREILGFLEPLGIPELESCLTPLRGASGDTTEEAALKGFLTRLLGLDDEEQRKVVEAAVRGSGGDSPEERWVRRIADDYPGDVGILGPYYLNLFTLEPGEAVYLSARVLHAYLEGFGIELMANSDNVLRGGLTSKHVDVPELESVLRFTAELPSRITGNPEAPGVVAYPAPAEEFDLLRLEPRASKLKRIDAVRTDRVGIYICTEGTGRVVGTEEEFALDFSKGDSFIAFASAGKFVLKGECVLYEATVP
jgi:mannose-6-phosphate isomerase